MIIVTSGDMTFRLNLTSKARISRSSRDGRRRLTIKAVAAPELSPEQAGTAGAKNQLDALKKMSKIVADSGVRVLFASEYVSVFQSEEVWPLKL